MDSSSKPNSQKPTLFEGFYKQEKPCRKRCGRYVAESASDLMDTNDPKFYSKKETYPKLPFEKVIDHPQVVPEVNLANLCSVCAEKEVKARQGIARMYAEQQQQRREKEQRKAHGCGGHTIYQTTELPKPKPAVSHHDLQTPLTLSSQQSVSGVSLRMNQVATTANVTPMFTGTKRTSRDVILSVSDNHPTSGKAYNSVDRQSPISKSLSFQKSSAMSPYSSTTSPLVPDAFPISYRNPINSRGSQHGNGIQPQVTNNAAYQSLPMTNTSNHAVASRAARHRTK